jgi:hypothetical protein
MVTIYLGSGRQLVVMNTNKLVASSQQTFTINVINITRETTLKYKSTHSQI